MTTPDSEDEDVGVLIDVLRDILRRNGDWDVMLRLHGIYGTIEVAVKHFNKDKYTDHGMSLLKRLRNATVYLDSQGIR